VIYVRTDHLKSGSQIWRSREVGFRVEGPAQHMTAVVFWAILMAMAISAIMTYKVILWVGFHDGDSGQ
jgi:hypothetical protein